ncbi:MAG TPA: CAP domain-containing protein [Candidatus Nitrosocosmicus sp.]
MKVINTIMRFIVLILLIFPFVTSNALAKPSNNLGFSNTSNSVNINSVDNTILNIHNQERALVRVPPLVWSNTLAAGAQTWANHLVTLNSGTFIDNAQLVHSSQSDRPNQGENLADMWWTGNGGGPTPTQLVQLWVNEKNGPPVYTDHPLQWPGDQRYGHYTQMIWKTTTAVGCATATSSGPVSAAHGGGSGNIVYLVCRYSPQGNIIGQMPY